LGKPPSVDSSVRGAVFVDINDANMVAALSSDKSSVTLVVRNGESSGSKNIAFDLTALSSVGAKVDFYRPSATEDLTHLTAVPVQNWSFTATVTAYSITTYVIAL